MGAGIFAGLFQKGVSWAQQLVTNARIGKQVLAAGATVSTTTTGAGQTTQFSGSGGAVQMPAWVKPVGFVALGIVALILLGKLLAKLFK